MGFHPIVLVGVSLCKADVQKHLQDDGLGHCCTAAELCKALHNVILPTSVSKTNDSPLQKRANSWFGEGEIVSANTTKPSRSATILP